MGGPWGILGRSLGVPGGSLGLLGGPLGGSLGFLREPWCIGFEKMLRLATGSILFEGSLAADGIPMLRAWGSLRDPGAPWGVPGRFLGILGRSLGSVGDPWGSRGGPWEILGAPWRSLGGLWEVSRCFLGGFQWPKGDLKSIEIFFFFNIFSRIGRAVGPWGSAWGGPWGVLGDP